MKTYLWIRKYIRLHPSGSGNSSLSREALAIEELVALKGCCEKKPDSTLCDHNVKDLPTWLCLPVHRPHGPWAKSHLSTHAQLLLRDSPLCVSINICAHLGSHMYRQRGPPICAVGATCLPMASTDSLINWLLISFYLRLHVCLWTLYGGDRHTYIHTYTI